MQTVISFLLFIGIAYIILKSSRTTVLGSGVISTHSGNEYTYEAGNNILGAEGPFNGMRVLLPKYLPPIYLDSHGDSKNIGPRRTFDNSLRLTLEGDFNTYFQLFSPKGYQNLVLSIITPDVMSVLIDSDKEYDIEIYGTYLRFIKRKKFRKHNAVPEDLLRMATVLIEEIDQKMNSWTTDNETEAQRAQMKSYDQEAVKIFGRYYGIGWVTIGAALLTSALFYILAFSFHQAQGKASMLFLALGVFFFPGLPIAMLFISRLPAFKK